MSRSRSIGGRLDLAALMLLCGSTGRDLPDRQVLRAAIVELRSRGLTARDIGQALGLAEAAVRELLEVRT